MKARLLGFGRLEFALLRGNGARAIQKDDVGRVFENSFDGSDAVFRMPDLQVHVQ